MGGHLVRRSLFRCATVLAAALALMMLPQGPGATGEAQAATSFSTFSDGDGMIGKAAFNPGLHYFHSTGKPGPGPNFFQIYDRCDDGLTPGVEWLITEGTEAGTSYRKELDGDCKTSVLLPIPFRISALETHFVGKEMPSMTWHFYLKAQDGSYAHRSNSISDRMGSYADVWDREFYTESSVYREPYGRVGSTITVTVVPTDEGYSGGPVAADDDMNEMWDEIQEETPVPSDLSSDQVESLKKQLWCHLAFAVEGWTGGPTWDLEAERPNISWEEVKGLGDLKDHRCNWGSDEGSYYRPPTNGSDPADLAPVVDAGPDVTTDEGGEVTLRGTAADDRGTPTSTWTYTRGDDVDEGAACTFTDAGSPRTGFTCTDDGTYTVKLTADDGVHHPVSDSATVTVRNVAPTLTLESPDDWDVHRVENEVAIAASFTDPGSNDTHTCTVTWDDGSTSRFPATSGRCEATHVYEHAGMDTVSVRVTDDDAGEDSGERMIVVYDPRAGLVSGSGTLADGAGYSVTAKYLTTGSTVPAGTVALAVPTEDGKKALLSTGLDWLVITPEGKVAVKGRSATHGFVGYLEKDAFRGVVWPLSQGATPPSNPLYDSTPGASWDLDEARPQPLRTGLTVIDTGWIPGLPTLPGGGLLGLGGTLPALLDGLPTLGGDVADGNSS